MNFFLEGSPWREVALVLGISAAIGALRLAVVWWRRRSR
jgi:hypothetical protein